MMERIKNILDSALKVILVVLIAGMTFNVLWQVFTRFVLQNPSSYTEELARYSLVWAGILGAAYVAGQKMHLAIDLLLMNLDGNKKLLVEIVIQAFIFLFASSVMVVGGLRLVNITLTLNQLSAALQIPLGYVYLVLPLSGTIICFYSLFFISRNIKEMSANPAEKKV